MKRAVGVVVVLALLAVLAVSTGTKVQSTCGGYVSTPAVIRGLDGAKKTGDALKNLIEGGPTPLETATFVHRTLSMLAMWWDELRRTALGEPESSAAKAWRVRVSEEQQAALEACCQANPGAPDDGGGSGDPQPNPASISYRAEQGSDSGFTPTASQVEIGRTIIAVGKAKGVTANGWVIATGAGLVESELRNLHYGDRDSLGVFQQRPSAGWGSAAQILDVEYAAGKFYDALKRKPWESADTDAKRGRVAQAVQASAFPDRYAARMGDARKVIARAGGDAVPAAPDSPSLACGSQSTPSGSGGSSKGGGPVPPGFNRLGNPRTVEQAVAFYQSRIPSGNGLAVYNQCERWATLAYGWPGGYPTARAHWNAPGERHPGVSTVPRGALVFWAPNHVALSLGNGVVASTDYDGRTGKWAPGKVGIGPIGDIDKWAGSRLGWRPPSFRGLSA